ncbi:MAG: helix-turn-helix transcriptional regulator, partial [Clostridia bacterium]|nr:helix-turn-helix transcriptional regulator [Clostridia bacterium]
VANALDVSIAAVSKWETGNSCPDIELLPTIAALFDVSLVYLMGYTRTAQKTVEEHIAHAYTLIRERRNREADDYMTCVRARYPENNLVKIESARIKRIRTCGTNETPLAKELLRHAETLLKSVNFKELTRREYDHYYATLADVYRIGRKYEEAAAAIDEILPADKFCPEQQKYLIELDRGNADGAIAGMQKLTFRAIHEIISTSSWYYTAYADTPEKIIEQNDFVLRLLEAVTDGHPSPFDRDLCYTCECIAYQYAKLGNADASADYFRRAMEYAARFDRLEVMTYTHLPAFAMLDETFESGLDFYPHGTGSLTKQTAAIVTECGEERREYVLLRSDERVQAILTEFC